MCLAKAYLNKWDDEPVLQDIAHMRLHGGQVELETLLGEEKVIPGRVVEVDFRYVSCAIRKASAIEWLSIF